jgi:tetratricopeptide (TPR) repeat protein
VEAILSAYEGDGPYVFICHSHSDRELIYPELAWLGDQGINVWYDDGIAPGTDWSQGIADAIEGAQLVLYYVSRRSIASEHCRREISFAQSHGRPILVVYLEEVELPGSLELSLGNRQALHRHRLATASYREKLTAALLDPDIPLSDESGTTLGQWRRAATYAVGLTICIGIALWIWTLRNTPETPVPVEGLSTTLVVNQFTSPGDDPQLSEFVRRAAEDIWYAFEDDPYVEVTANPSTISAQTNERLRGDYHLRGQVKLAEQLLSVLIVLESRDGQVLWQREFDQPIAVGMTEGFIGADSAAATIAQLAFIHQNVTERFPVGDDIRGLYYKSVQAEFSGRTAAAYELLLRFLEIQPENAVAHARMVNLCCPDSQLRPADLVRERRRWGERAIELDPDLFLPYWLLARLERNTGNYEQAAVYLAEARNRGAHGGWIHAAWGEIHMRQGRLEDAVQRFNRALDVGVLGDVDYSHYALGRALLYLDRDEEALAAFDRAQRLSMGRFGIPLTYDEVITHAKLGQITEAEQKLHSAITAGAPQPPGLLWVLGRQDAAREKLAELESRYKQGERGLLIVGIFDGHAALDQWVDAFIWLERLLEDVRRDPAPGPNRLNFWFWVPRLYANDLQPLRQNPNFPDIERQIEVIRKAQVDSFAPLD